MRQERYKVSVDIGGTFTDVVTMRESDGEIYVIKVPSTQDDPSRAFLQGIQAIYDRLDIHPGDISCLVHGSTVGINAVVEGKLPKTALITTEGFRDVLELARMIRPSSYDLHFSKARSLVPRHLRFEVAERVGADGKIVKPLTQEEIHRVVSEVKASGAQAVAVCCLFSFLNPTHEQALGEALEKELPQCKICLSSYTNPIFREYERTCVTVLNAALVSVMSSYLQKIMAGLHEMGCFAPLYIMRQDGGYMGSEMAQVIPIQALVSGPTGGALMANYLGNLEGARDVISIDVGGTTADVCMTTQGQIQIADQLLAGGYPLSIRSIEVNAVGAGGGSIAWVDKGGGLHVGPKSAGSFPGPIAYGLGGTNVTLTDANLALGRLDSCSLLNGEMTIRADLAKDAVARLARDIHMTPIEAAEGIVKIAVANMAKGIRVISVERGLDLRDFALVPFGGGGPMYASEIARELGIPKVIIPYHPGTGSAFGLLTSDLRHVASRSYVTTVNKEGVEQLQTIAQKLEKQVLCIMENEGHHKDDVSVSAVADFRYRGQSYEIPVSVTVPITVKALEDAVENFHQSYEQRYGHCNRGQVVETVNLHIIGEASIGRAKLKKIAKGHGSDKAAIGNRVVIFGGKPWESTIYQRDKLGAEDRVLGPAIIQEYDSTTILWPNDVANVDEYGNLIINYKIAI